MNEVLGYLESFNRRRKNDNLYDKWIYDFKVHRPIISSFSGLTTFCGLRKSTYALNYYNIKEFNCKKCNFRYKYFRLIIYLGVYIFNFLFKIKEFLRKKLFNV